MTWGKSSSAAMEYFQKCFARQQGKKEWKKEREKERKDLNEYRMGEKFLCAFGHYEFQSTFHKSLLDDKMVKTLDWNVNTYAMHVSWYVANSLIRRENI